ncbi:hypothetical protein Tco_0677727 [Tanacetum coccineum]|uniref:Uncharacterized protein n=1 Tax=Tanacetum coccineum TaxID=301880 RepID=A0ABQ4XD18_9ASTR
MSYAKDGEVVIKLMLFAGRPDPPSHRGSKRKFFLRGSNTELFCVIIGLKRLDLTGKTPEEMEEEKFNDILDMSSEIWEQMEDLKDANFFVDLARDNSVAYSPAVASESGVKYTSVRSIPFVAQGWLAADYAKAKKEVEDQDCEIVVRQISDDDVEHNELQLLDLPLGDLEMIMEFCIGLEYLNFCATCKRCHLAAPVLQWRGEATLKRLENYSYFRRG